MSKLAIKYDGCQKTIDDLKNISNCKYEDLINDLKSVLNSLEELTYKPNTSGISSSISKAEENKQKLIDFAVALDSYAEKLYQFDNGFYNNFVKLDGTNSENYNKNIGSINISDDEIEKLYINDKNCLEKYLYQLMEAIKDDYNSDDNSIIMGIRDEIEKFTLAPENVKALALILKGNSFEIIENGEDIFIKLKKGDLDTSDLEKCAKYLHDELKILTDRQLNSILNGTSGNKTIKFIERLLSDDGAKIYDGTKDKLSGYAKKILKGEYDDLNKYIKQIGLNDVERALLSAKDAGIEDLIGEGRYIRDNFGKAVNSIRSGDILDDIKNAKLSSKVEFAGKALGVVDKVVTIWDNANDNLKDENGNWDFSDGEKDKEFVVDTAVDLGSSAAAAATGAAIGSVVPVVGTVVGAVAGAAIGIAINYKFGDPPESVVDKTKELANDAVDKIGDCIGKIFW